MGKEFIICLLLLLQGFVVASKAQEPVIQVQRDSSFSLQAKQVDVISDLPATDTVRWVKDEQVTVTKKDTIVLKVDDFKPNPTKAVLYSAIFPGLGQIYNRKYWKLPIIYGGVAGLVYAISWNGSKYGDYSKAYKGIMLLDDDYSSWSALLGYGVNASDIVNNPSELQRYRDRFKRQKDMFRQNRDLAIIVSVGVYVLCMIDAYVDAQLYDFDVSPDISMRIEPVIIGPSQFSTASVGLRCSINF